MIPIWRGFGFALGVVLSANSHADGAAIAKTGAGAAPACQTCHGAAGEGIALAGFPRLSGLGAPYMQRQFDAFTDGTRVSAVMMPIAKALSVADRAAVSAYYAALPVQAAQAAALPAAPASAPAVAPASAGVSATLATRGRWADKLPACEQCHGPGSRGVGPDFPALTGQGATYLASQLMAWKPGARPPGHERPQDPRYAGSVQATRHDFHATEDSMYGREVAGKVLGASGAPKPFKPLKERRS